MKKDYTEQFHESLTQRAFGVYSRAEIKRLWQSKVCIIGLGCIGGLVAIILARMGVSRFLVFDEDFYEVANLNRQPFAFRSTIGKNKAAVVKKYLRDINQDVEVDAVEEHFTHSSEKRLGKSSSDVVLQCIDDMKSRFIVHKICRDIEIPVITMSGQPPQRAIVSTFLKGSPSYEAFFGLNELEEVSVGDLDSYRGRFQNMKMERAKASVRNGALHEWFSGFDESFGWAVTPERTYVAGTLMAHEAIRLLVGRTVHAEAPRAILINLEDNEFLVRITSPEEEGARAQKKGDEMINLAVRGDDGNWHWDYRCF